MNSISRRTFLGHAGLTAAALASGCATTGPRRIAANSKLAHACIGVGGMGGADRNTFASHARVQIVALCDVDRHALEQAGRQYPGARLYADWRELFAQEGDRIDSVNVSTPDHMHAPIALTALRAGKHAYVQKPLAHDVAECRALNRAAVRAGVVTQLGTQHASGMGDRLAVQFLQQGLIGRATHVYVFSNRPGIESYRLAGPRPAEPATAPAHLDWDRWIGTAPMRPYAPSIYHPGVWRCWQDFGTGWSGDIGCHVFDAVWKGLGLRAPVSVEAEVQTSWRDNAARRADTWPQSNHITWVFPGATGSRGEEITVEWFDGEFRPPAEARARAAEGGVSEFPAEGAMVIGTDGAMLIPHQSGPILFPRERFTGLDRNLPKVPNHYHRFVDACLGVGAANSSFDISGPMAETILLGTIAIRIPGERLRWNSNRLRFIGHDAADRLLRRTYRDGWAVSLGV